MLPVRELAVLRPPLTKEMSKNKKKAPQARIPKKREPVERKLWGTKSDSAKKMRECIVKTVPETTSVEVKRVFKNEDGQKEILVEWGFW